MPDQTQPAPQPMFTEQKPEKAFPVAAVGIAAVAVVILAVVLVLMGRHDGSKTLSASYAPNIELGGIQMSESESLSGGKSTYLDGKLANHGTQTVTGVTVQVTFPTDSGSSPQSMTVPVQLIRSREPYIDVVPVSAAPIAPAGSADFRLIFEGVNDAWNQQTPNIQVTGVSTR